MYIVNKRGPKTEHWGTLYFKAVGEDVLPSATTGCYQSGRTRTSSKSARDTTSNKVLGWIHQMQLKDLDFIVIR